MSPLDRIKTLWELFLAGGLLMWPIVAMSLVVVTFGIERLVALRRGRFVPKELRDGLAGAESKGAFDPRKAYRLCDQFPSVAADVVKAALEKIGRPLPEIERVVEVEKERQASRLYANIRPISLAVTVTPLLGLLGTTFAGLCVAIPAAMIAHFLEGRIMRGFRGVDEVVAGVLPHLERYENKGRVTPEQLRAEPAKAGA